MRKIVAFIVFGPVMLNLLFWVAPYFANLSYSSSQNTANINEQKCMDCHAKLMEKETKHPAAMDDGCENCHIKNGKEHPKKDTIAFALSDKLPDLCFGCHDGIQKDITTLHSVHQIVNQKKLCVNCHSPHSSDKKKLLSAEDKDLCLTCHNKIITTKTKKLANMKQLLAESKVIHPALEGGCLSCHKPHASANDYLLAKSFPSGEYVKATKDTFALCFDCHDADLLMAETTTSATNFRDGSKNLHFLHVNKDKGRNCIMCHNVHASSNEHLILSKIPFGNWNMPMNYLPNDKGGSCQPGCHTEKKYTR